MSLPPGTSIAITLGKVIAGYSGYKKGKSKEDDLAVRLRLAEELDKSRNYLFNLLENAYLENDTMGAAQAQSIIDLIDNLKKEVTLASTGHKYALFSQQHSISSSKMKKLIRYDASVIQKSIELSEKLEEVISANLESESLVNQLKNIKNEFVSLQASFRERIEYLKGMRK